ncbi:hypothetical protein [Aquimarina longa]|uniref:hypothetical protein n=1 Tax=Aquimarina longa TaxID=1080221 RepID=UPI0011DFFCF3|nr:hypothetical protein [Aquimarina longa]
MQEKLLERIINAIKHLGLTGYEIAEKTPLSQVGIDKILNRTSTKPRDTTIEVLYNLLSKEYNISKSWLNHGLGDMKDETNEKDNNSSIDNIFKELISKTIGYKLDEILLCLETIKEQNKEIIEYIDSQRLKDLVSVEKERVSKNKKTTKNT